MVDLGKNIEVSLVGLSFVKRNVLIVGDNVVLTEVLLSPLSDVLNKRTFVLFKGKMLSRVGKWSEIVCWVLVLNFLKS